MKKILLFLITTTIIVFAQQLRLKQDTISLPGTFSNYPFLIKDFQNKLHSVFTSQLGQSVQSKEIFYSTEKADSFEVINITNNNSDETFSSVTVDKNGFSHIAFLGRDTSGNFQIKYTNNLSGSFSDPIYITYDGVNKTMLSSVVTQDSMVHFFYYTNNYTDNKINYISYNYGNLFLSSPVSLGEGESHRNNDISVAVDRKGKLHVVFKSGPGESGKLRYFNNVKGSLREINTDVERNIISPQIVIDRFNTVNILFKDTDDNRLYLLNNISGNFGEPIPVTPEGINPTGFNNFAVDDVGRFYIVYQTDDTVNNFKKAFYLIYSSGKRFSLPHKIYEWVDGGFSGNSASIVAHGNGQISVLISKADIRNFIPVSDLILFRGQIFGNPFIEAKERIIAFRNTAIGDTSVSEIKIKNTGTAILKIFPNKPSNFNFRLLHADTIYIKPDSTAKIKLVFSPDDSVDYKSTLQLFSNAVNLKSIKLELSGRGYGAPALAMDKDSVYLIQENNFTDSLLIVNIGFTPLKIDSVKYYSDFDLSFSFESATILPGDSLVLKLKLLSDSEDFDEYFADSLIIYSNDPKNPRIKLALSGKQFILASKEEEKPLSELYQLHQNYPNPFNPLTTISFTLNEPAFVKLSVFDALAREIALLVDENLPSGTHNVVFDGEQLSTGVYYYKLQIKSGSKKQPDYVEVKKMILVK